MRGVALHAQCAAVLQRCVLQLSCAAVAQLPIALLLMLVLLLRLPLLLLLFCCCSVRKLSCKGDTTELQLQSHFGYSCDFN